MIRRHRHEARAERIARGDARAEAPVDVEQRIALGIARTRDARRALDVAHEAPSRSAERLREERLAARIVLRGERHLRDVRGERAIERRLRWTALDRRLE